MTPNATRLAMHTRACTVLIALLLAASHGFAAPPQAVDLDSDRIIVRLKPAAAADASRGNDKQRSAKAKSIADRLAAKGGESLAPVKQMSDGSQVLRMGKRINKGQLTALAAKLASDSDVEEVLLDRLFLPQLTPNDPQFPQQWGLSSVNGIHAQGAWDLSTGSPNLVIAILDTGKLPHTELAARWIGGHDFVSEVVRGNDGDMRDGDATDPGDWVTSADGMSGPLAGCPITNSRWHGTAMAAVIGATANNAAGIAGINWNSRLLPVRVVGKCGGYESDIADGLRWAAGLNVPGVPANPNPAKIVNMSLASAGICSSALQSAVDSVIGAGVAIIAAAGNNSANAAAYSPGNCAGAIAVGAVDKNGGKPAYSNFGPPVALSAPGGTGNTNPEAILTASNDGPTTSTANLDYLQTITGTSIAAAHVTGIASLMLSITPGLSPADLKDLLTRSARTFPSNTTAVMPGPSQADCTVSLCGSGIAHAQLATQWAFDWRNTTAKIAMGQQHAVALASDGQVYTWGRNTEGQLGDGSVVNRSTPVLTSLRGAKFVAAGRNTTLAIRVDGTVWAWGENAFGQLGDGTTVNRPSPVQTGGIETVVYAASGSAHGIALKSDGTVWTWGRNHVRQLGDGTFASRAAPAAVAGLSGVIAVAASANQSFALKSDGTIWAWGESLGDPAALPGATQMASISANTTRSGVRGVKTNGTLWDSDGAVNAGISASTDNTQFAAGTGSAHLLALKTNGDVWSWGNNFNGALGRGTSINNFSAPAVISSISQSVKIAANHGQSMALKNDGTVWTWGYNSHGQMGNNAIDLSVPRDSSLSSPGAGDQPLPAAVLGPNAEGLLYLDRAAASFIAVSDLAPVGVRISNPILVTGVPANSAISVSGGLYRIDSGGFTSSAGTVNPDQTVTLQINVPGACGSSSTATLTIAGTPRTFTVSTAACDSMPDAFELRNAIAQPVSTFAQSNTVTITGINTPVAVGITGGEHSVGCTGTFTASSGSISNGQSLCVRALASATANTVTTATLTVGSLSRTFTVFSAVAPAFATTPAIRGYFWHALGLRSDGTVFAWGDNQFGGLGDGTFSSRSVPVRALISGALQVATGTYFSVALHADGTVWTWGINDRGQLGHGSTNDAIQPTRISGLTGVTDIATGDAHVLARKSDGTVWAWGRNDEGQLGDGTTVSRNAPVLVSGLTGATHVAAGDNHSLARKSDGTVVAWGGNSSGQLGDASTTTRLAPVAVSALTGVASVAAGGSRSAALKTDGTVWSFGAGPNGNNTSGQSSVPVQASGLTGVAEVYVSDHTLARKTDGTVWSWGANDYGQLGIGNTSTRLIPTQITSLAGFTAIGGGYFSSYGIGNGGVAVAWGDNDEGELGYGFFGGAYFQPYTVIGEGSTGVLNLDASITTFATIGGVVPGSVNTSNTVRFNSISNGSAISIAGGEYRIDNGTFTTVAGTINAGQTVTVRQTASSTCNTSTTATLTVGALTRTYTVITQACDATPAAFSFVNRVAVATGSPAVSNTVTVSGINQPAAISITGGEYSIGCTGTFVTTAGSIANGQTVCIRVTASASADTLSTATLTIGGVSSVFRVISAVSGAFTTAPMANGGANHSIALQSDGTVWTWGRNNHGQLGSGTSTASRVPIQALLSGAIAVAAGERFSVALRSDGTVWTWGGNDQGQLGDGTTTSRSVPQPVAGLTGITHIAAGWDFVIARKNDGTVWGWGYNLEGQLADGSFTNRSTPVQANGIVSATAVAAGFYHSLARKSDGTLWAWGYNGDGALGDGTTTDRNTAIQVPGLVNVTSAAAGERHTLAVRSDGSLSAWGENPSGQLGDGSTTARLSPATVSGVTNVVEATAGRSHSMIRRQDGTVWAWGANSVGQVGDGTFAKPGEETAANRLSPVQVIGLAPSQRIGAGWRSSFSIDTDGVLWSWGENPYGQLGNGTLDTALLAARVPSPGNDDYFYLTGIDTRPSVFAFNPAFGVLPNSTAISNTIVVSGLRNMVSATVQVTGGEVSINGGPFTASPANVVNGNSVTVRTLSSSAFSTTTQATVTIGGATGRAASYFVRTRRDPAARAIRPQVAAGNGHSLVLAPTGIVLAAGYNSFGQLANGTTYSSSEFRPVSGSADVISIASGDHHALALQSDGTLIAWGYNASGQLGNGTDTNTTLRVSSVTGLTNVESVAAGANHSLAKRADGTVWAWGLNSQGQIGTGTAAARLLSPTQVTSLSGVVAIAAGRAHSLALMADGTIRAWGANESGQLGNGNQAQQNAPITVSGLANVVAIAAAGNHSLALKADRTVVAWGNNDFGQLGDGGNVSRSLPGAVLGLSSVGIIGAGATHSLAVKSGGAMFAWGGNANAQLGDDTNTNRTAPVMLTVPASVAAVAGGQSHTLAIDSAGKVTAFGDNFFGQLGNRSGNYQPHTQPISVIRGDARITGFGGNATTTIGATSTSGSAVIDLAGLATDFDFGELPLGGMATVEGRFKNQALTETITGISINVLNTGGSAFSVVNNTCGATLAAGTECSFQVQFGPTASGDMTGRVEVQSSLVGSPELRQLLGRGIAPASPGLRLTTTGQQNYFLFEPQSVGTRSLARAVVLTNTGTAPLALSNATIAQASPDYAVENANTCASVAPAASCTMEVTFAPAQPNNPSIRSALLTLATNAGTQSVTLEGAAVPNDGTTAGIVLTNVLSRRNHGTVASPNLRALPVDRTKTINQALTIEPRLLAAGHAIVFQFNGPVTHPGSVVLSDANGLPIPGAGVNASALGNDVIVVLQGVTGIRRVTVALVGVNGSVNASAAIGFLAGDFNASGKVTAADLAALKARLNQPLSVLNFAYDVNGDGVIGSSDVSAAKARAGSALP
ncbi:MAG: S8 family serine peptidase [Betaproteobacteria bacterium]|nr:S8 family serine peptidase [Betaproteobacteria bacterium]